MKIITKKYLFRNVDTAENGMCIRYVSGVQAEHDELSNAIKEDGNVVFCAVEYVHEIDLEAIGCPEIVKNIVKEDINNETL